jgi:hypothetical protein
VIRKKYFFKNHVQLGIEKNQDSTNLGYDLNLGLATKVGTKSKQKNVKKNLKHGQTPTTLPRSKRKV